MNLPPKVTIRPGQTIKEYWVDRATQHLKDSYMGVPMMKFPEDLRVYEHLLHASHANVVLELGSFCGGSALWFRDRLRARAAYDPGDDYHVISVDLYPERARGYLEHADKGFREHITLLRGDVQDVATLARVRTVLGKLGGDPRLLVVEDSGHTYETTLRALECFAQLVTGEGFYVVEDGYLNVDDHEFLQHSARRDVIPAIRDWLGTPSGQEFKLCREYELYGLTSHPEGVLRRRPTTTVADDVVANKRS